MNTVQSRSLDCVIETDLSRFCHSLKFSRKTTNDRGKSKHSSARLLLYMQDRYTGDIGDYIKYALLRALSPGLKLGIAWYLYPDENHNSDGKHVQYLQDPQRWRHLDPELFDALKQIVESNRSVSAVAAAGQDLTWN